jgi:hypothetical protein
MSARSDGCRSGWQSAIALLSRADSLDRHRAGLELAIDALVRIPAVAGPRPQPDVSVVDEVDGGALLRSITADAPYAIRSMAQTRAISRALRAPLGQIIVLAGYEATPAEEMPADEEQPRPQSSPAAPVEAKPEQYAEIGRLIERLTELRPAIDWKERAHELAGVPARMLTVTTAQMLIDRLAEKLATAEQFSNE